MILITIGRNKDNRYVIDDPEKRISGYHAELKICDDNSISLIDHSLNGVTVNGKKIDKEVEVQINRGTEIIFGGFAKLDWNRIPLPTPIPSGTILYSIGTHLTNRIMINDNSNMVSRYHATLKIDPKGKMTLNDHSANGTFVNGSCIASNQDIPVRRSDKIMFANSQPLNWSKIQKAKINPWYYIAPIAAVLIIGLVIILSNKGFGFHHEMSDTEIINKYDKAVVCVLHQYRIIAENANYKLVLKIDKEKKEFYYRLEKDPQARELIQGAFATAFFIDKKGTMMTNRHVVIPWESDIDLYKQVVASNDKLKNETFDIYGESLNIGFVLNGNTINKYSDFEDCVILSQKSDNIKKDVGLLQTKSKRLPNPEIIPIDINNAMIDPGKLASGQKVFVMGFPLGLNPSSLIGSGADHAIDVKSTNQGGTINTSPGPFVFGLNAQMTHGASGSPVLNDKGILIGVFNAGFDQTQGLNSAVLAKHAKELYDKAVQ